MPRVDYFERLCTEIGQISENFTSETQGTLQNGKKQPKRHFSFMKQKLHKKRVG